MKPIYYKHTESGVCYKFTPEENLSEKDIDDMLDAIIQDGREFIHRTVKEYYEKTTRSIAS